MHTQPNVAANMPKYGNIALGFFFMNFLISEWALAPGWPNMDLIVVVEPEQKENLPTLRRADAILYLERLELVE